LLAFFASQDLSVLTGANCELIQRPSRWCGSAVDVRTGPCQIWKAVKAKMSKTIRVLVVDDFETVRQWVRTRLERTRFMVAGEAADGREACQQAQRLLPELILLDLNLPDMNGFEVLKELGHAVPSATVLFLSAYNDADVVRHALEGGASGYVLKSEAQRELVPAMEAVVCGKKFVSRCLDSPEEPLNDPSPSKHQFADVT
jgi:DNA-binding NarL/FixJ family response regulator